MTYHETLDWMFTQLPMYQQTGKDAYNGKLDKILAFSAHLEYPEHKFKSIHIGGTNGKGSSSHMLASILQEAGYKVGLYTSPHLKDFRERIKVNGRSIPKKFVIDFIARNKDFLDNNNLSFFELTVGMAFQAFARQQVDIAIIEVGLGGRLDSTNIIVPEVALITNIGLDHLDILGDTLQKIAVEKAGIIKKKIPVVISEYQEEVADTFIAIAKEREAKILFADKISPKAYQTDLLGDYQAKNCKGVLATLGELRNFDITENHIIAGFKNVIKNTGLMGRWQVLGSKPGIVCDTAHNREGLTLVLRQLRQQTFQQLHIVLGFVKEKNLDLILPLFPKNASYYFARPDIPRGLNSDILKEKATAYRLFGAAYASVPKAFCAALENAGENDFIFVGGSTFVVAEVV